MRDNVVTRKFAKLALIALLALAAGTTTAIEEFKPNDLPAAAGICKQAISQSRMICLTGANCQRNRCRPAGLRCLTRRLRGSQE
jgi:hypothetical protein